MDEVAIAGGGPAGALAAIVLAHVGVRVRVFDRARFPRHKLCGDTLNPGALRVLARHLDLGPVLALSDPIDGMLLTGPRGVRVRAAYGRGTAGRAITRSVLDRWLLSQAVRAGASVEEGVTVKEAVIAGGRVCGLRVDGHGHTACEHRARIVIAADGRRSTLAIGRGLVRQPPRPRRWAIGSYFTDVDGMTQLGEMHVRQGHYIGVAPMPGGLTNACLVVPHAAGDAAIDAPADLLVRSLRADPELGTRFARARLVQPPAMLGPMAVDAAAAGEPGLLLAGDAAGFIDPMTGDGLRFAFEGAVLAAETALDVLAGRVPMDRAHERLAAKRRTAFAAKWRFNRVLRSLVASPRGVSGAAIAASVAPSLFEAIIRYAGDCDHDGDRQPGTGTRGVSSSSRHPAPGSRVLDADSRFPS